MKYYTNWRVLLIIYYIFCIVKTLILIHTIST